MKKIILIMATICIVACTNNTSKVSSSESDSVIVTIEEEIDSCPGYYDEDIDYSTGVIDDEDEEDDDDFIILEESYTSTPNTYNNPDYSTINLNSGTLHSEQELYEEYSNYKESSDCVEGVVVYEGDDDYYIVETRRGFTILEVYSGILYEGNKVRGELNRYSFRYIINRNRNSEVRVYIEDYALTEDDAIEWLGENDHLNDEDQRIYDANN